MLISNLQVPISNLQLSISNLQMPISNFHSSPNKPDTKFPNSTPSESFLPHITVTIPAPTSVCIPLSHHQHRCISAADALPLLPIDPAYKSSRCVAKPPSVCGHRERQQVLREKRIHGDIRVPCVFAASVRARSTTVLDGTLHHLVQHPQLLRLLLPGCRAERWVPGTYLGNERFRGSFSVRLKCALIISRRYLNHISIRLYSQYLNHMSIRLYKSVTFT